MKLEVTIEVEVVVDTETEYDDDGCGSPSRSGNSMTGYRGSYPVATGVTLCCSPAELARLVETAAYEQNEDRINEALGEDYE